MKTLICNSAPDLNDTYMVRWSLSACARIHGVTIRQIAQKMGITLKRVREVRDSKEVSAFTAWNFVQEIREIARARCGK